MKATTRQRSDATIDIIDSESTVIVIEPTIESVPSLLAELPIVLIQFTVNYLSIIDRCRLYRLNIQWNIALNHSSSWNNSNSPYIIQKSNYLIESIRLSTSLRYIQDLQVIGSYSSVNKSSFFPNKLIETITITSQLSESIRYLQLSIPLQYHQYPALIQLKLLKSLSIELFNQSLDNSTIQILSNIKTLKYLLLSGLLLINTSTADNDTDNYNDSNNSSLIQLNSSLSLYSISLLSINNNNQYSITAETHFIHLQPILSRLLILNLSNNQLNITVLELICTECLLLSILILSKSFLLLDQCHSSIESTVDYSINTIIMKLSNLKSLTILDLSNNNSFPITNQLLISLSPINQIYLKILNIEFCLIQNDLLSSIIELSSLKKLNLFNNHPIINDSILINLSKNLLELESINIDLFTPIPTNPIITINGILALNSLTKLTELTIPYQYNKITIVKEIFTNRLIRNAANNLWQNLQYTDIDIDR